MTLFLLIIITVELFFIWYSQAAEAGSHPLDLFKFKKDLSRFSDQELEEELEKRRHTKTLEDQVTKLTKEIQDLKNKEEFTQVNAEEVKEKVEQIDEKTSQD